MAKKSLEQIKDQIAKLQREADAARAAEVDGVVARIREAIGLYGITAQDIFGTSRGSKGRTARSGKRQTGVIRYQDGAGHTWTGHGKRPNWFKAAIEAGRSPEDLAAKP